jgi:hypothetical protein
MGLYRHVQSATRGRQKPAPYRKHGPPLLSRSTRPAWGDDRPVHLRVLQQRAQFSRLVAQHRENITALRYTLDVSGKIWVIFVKHHELIYDASKLRPQLH